MRFAARERGRGALEAQIIETHRREEFESAADLYDAARPSYPEELFDDLVELAALQKGDRLLEIGCATGKATRPLLDLLRDEKDGYGRRLAAYVLAYNRPNPDVAAPALLRALRDKDPVVRRQAAVALVHLGREAKGITKDLLAGLKDKNSDVRLKCPTTAIRASIFARSRARSALHMATALPMSLPGLTFFR